MGSGHYREGAGKPVGWSKVQESVTFPTSECCSCLNAELTYTNWVKVAGKEQEEDKDGHREGLEQYRQFLLPLSEGFHFQTFQKQNKQNKKKIQIPYQTKRAWGFKHSF